VAFRSPGRICSIRHCYVSVFVCMSSVILVHLLRPLVQNEITFGRDTRAVPRNIVLDRYPGPPDGKGRSGGRSPQFAAMPPIAKLRWTLFLCLDKNSCASSPCQQRCVSLMVGHQCLCNPGYKLVNKTKCIGEFRLLWPSLISYVNVFCSFLSKKIKD